MAKYTQNGDSWFVATDVSIPDFKDELPPGNYFIRHHQITGYYLTEAKPFSLGKIYGDISRRVDRILSTFVDRNRNTGVLAVGEKGSGKTLLTQLLAIEAAKKHGIPTIIVDGGFHGPDFNNFLAKIDGRVLILFDEFEKSYDDEGQMSLLTIFDGVYQSNKLFMFTANNEYKIDRSMISRPGRIYYRFKYEHIDENFVREYCKDKLKDQNKTESIVRIIDAYGGFTFDKLKALVEETNRYDETPAEAIKHLNIDFSDVRLTRYYDVEFFRDGVSIHQQKSAVNFNPFGSSRQVRLLDDYIDEDADRNEDDEETQKKAIYVTLSPDKIVGVANGQSKITYKTDGLVVVLKEPTNYQFDYHRYADGYDQT